MTVIASTIIESAGALHACNPCHARGLGYSPTKRREMKMRAIWKLGVPAATFVVAATLGAATLGLMTPSSATAKEFCRQDVTGHMTGCGYDSMEQCQAASSGIGGDCFRDPNLPPPGASAANSRGINANAFASQPNRQPRNAFARAPRGAHPRG